MRLTRARSRRCKPAALAITLALTSSAIVAGPVLWGYGVKTCAQFRDAAPGAGAPSSIASEEFKRYREWFAGLISGLNLASGSDVLRGAELEAALTRVYARCRDEPNQDFFNASVEEIKSLSRH